MNATVNLAAASRVVMNDRLADRTAAYFFQFPLRNATISRNYSLQRKDAREGGQEGTLTRVGELSKSPEVEVAVLCDWCVSLAGVMY